MDNMVYKPTKVWNSNFIRIMLVCLLFFTTMQLANVNFPLYLQSLGASPAVMGSSTALLTLGALVMRPVVGSLADKKSKRFVMLLGLTIIAACFLSFMIFPIVMVVMAFRTIQGLGISAGTTANMAIATDVLPPQDTQKGLAYFGLCETIALAVGPSLGLLLSSGGSYVPVWASCVIIAIVAGIITFSFSYEKKKSKDEIKALEETREKPKNIKEWFWKAFEKKSLIVALPQLFIAFLNASIFSFLAAYAAELGLESTGVFFAVQAIGMFGARIAVGKLIDSISSKFFLIAPAAISLSLSFICIIFMQSTAVLLIAGVLFGIGSGLSMAVFSVSAMTAAEPARRGAASTTYYLICDIGFGTGSLIGGLIADALGYRNLFIVLAFVPIIVILLSLKIFGAKRKTQS